MPCIAALLLTAAAAAAEIPAAAGRAAQHGRDLVTLLITAVVLGGLGTLVANRVSADYPTLLAEAKHTTAQVQSWLAGPPFHLKSTTSRST